MVYCFDIDGTICTDVLESNPQDAVPNHQAIDEINKLYNSCNKILIFTSRDHYGEFKELTLRQLRSWKVNYHELIYRDKPKYDILIDSKSMNSSAWLRNAIINPKKIGLVASCFDLLHAGHCIMLQDAKRVCDYLVVALQEDPSIDRPEKNKPIQSLLERKIQIEAIKYVDEVITYKKESDLELLIKRVKPDIRILGSDYIDKEYTGKDMDKEVYFHNRNHNWSTTELRERVKNVS